MIDDTAVVLRVTPTYSCLRVSLGTLYQTFVQVFFVSFTNSEDFSRTVNPAFLFTYTFSVGSSQNIFLKATTHGVKK